MKRSILTVLFALICVAGFSQVSFNVKTGLNLSSYIGKNSDGFKFKPGGRVGIGMEYQFTDLVSLQPTLFFSQRGAKISSEDVVGDIFDVKGDVKINQLYMELPINVQLRFNVADNVNFLVATGPYLACGVGGKTKVEASVGEHSGDVKFDTFGDDKNSKNLHRFDAGWGFGVGVEISRFLIGLDTQLGFTKIANGDAPHNANIGITVGYKF